MANIHRVIEYSGLNYHEVLALPCDIYMLMLRNSVVEDYLSTEQGREYLERCALYDEVEPDVDGLRRAIGVRCKEVGT